MENVHPTDGSNKASTPHQQVVNSLPRAMVLHTRGGNEVFPYDERALAFLTDPERETGPWYATASKGVMHLVHDEFTGWHDPRPAGRRNDREAML